MIEQHFHNLGISQTGGQVFLALAELGKSTPAVLAKRCKLPRSTVYTALASLESRGLVTQEQTSHGALYLANQPEAFLRAVNRERAELESKLSEKESSAQELINLVQPYFQSKNYSVPKLQFFEGRANVEAMLYDNCFEWQKSIAQADYTWWGYQDHGFVEQYRGWLDYYWAKLHENERILLFSNRSDTERKLKGKVQRREIKLVPQNFNISSTIWILGEYVISIVTQQEPHYAFQMRDHVFAANQRQIFQLLWQSQVR
jgi:DNA-binding MarR family transcriptional regulator